MDHVYELLADHLRADIPEEHDQRVGWAVGVSAVARYLWQHGGLAESPLHDGFDITEFTARCGLVDVLVDEDSMNWAAMMMDLDRLNHDQN